MKTQNEKPLTDLLTLMKIVALVVILITIYGMF